MTTAAKRADPPQALCQASTARSAPRPRWASRWPGCRRSTTTTAQTVLSFVERLHDTGRLRLRTVRLPYAEPAPTYLFDGLVSGTCPACLAGSCGGTCEGCGHPNNFDELLEPRSTIDPADPVSYREHTILVLPMEEYRERLSAYFAARQDRWRPHSMQLIRELLAGPLPDIPMTMPGDAGASRRRSPRPRGRSSTRGSRRCRRRCTAPGGQPASRASGSRRRRRALARRARRRDGLLPRLRQRLPLGPDGPGAADGSRRPVRAAGKQRLQRVLRPGRARSSPPAAIT